MGPCLKIQYLQASGYIVQVELMIQNYAIEAELDNASKSSYVLHKL